MERLICVFVFVSIQLTAFGQKINGLSISGPSTPDLSIENFEELKTANANWVGIVPERLVYRETLGFRPDSQNEHWSETIEATIQSIKIARQTGLKIFVKPHIVLEKKSKNEIRQKVQTGEEISNVVLKKIGGTSKVIMNHTF